MGRQKKLHFLTHLRLLNGHLALMYLIKNQFISVAYGVLHVLFWIFEYVTDWPFAGLLGVDFKYFLTFQILAF